MASWIRVNEHDSGELLGYANDDVGIHQDAKDSAADGAGTVAETAAATAVVVGSGGAATALGGGFGALCSLTGGGVFSRESTDLAGKMIDNLPPANTGGRRAVDEYSFKDTGYTTVQIEQMRQALLDRADIGRMQKSLQAVGVKVDREMIEMVKRYNFDSHGIVMDYRNYEAWNRLAQGEGTITDAAYMVHEIAEIKALQRVQQEIGFDFMGRDNVPKMTEQQKDLWESAFDEMFLLVHRQALEVEYDFIYL
ncbi:MAG: hypothetical protein P8101_18610 [Candidatus Thiodiazotropha sp.]